VYSIVKYMSSRRFL